jgi:acyl carrier protein
MADARVAVGVADLFSDVLGRSRCEVDDSFFRLGGTSMAALRIIAQMEERYGVRLALVDIFDYPTPAMIAERLAEAGAGAGERAVPDVATPLRADAPYPLALSQEGFHTMSTALDGTPSFNIVGGLRFTGDVDSAAIVAAVRIVARRQAAMRTSFGTVDGVPVQHVGEATPAVAEVDVTGAGLRRLLAAQHAKGFRLAEGPPVRFTLARFADDGWALLWTVHHLLFDGISDGILADELVHAYRAALGAVPERPPLPRQYVDFAQWQRETFTGERLAGAVDALAAVLSTPAPAIAPAVPGGYRSRLESFPVDPADEAGLRRRAIELDVSMFVVLLSVVTDFAARRNGLSRQRLLVQAANRRQPGSEHLIGCFANMLLVESDGPPGTPAEERIPSVRTALTRALEHEEVPVEAVLWRLADRGVAVAAGMPGLGLLVQPDRMGPVEAAGCRVERVPADPKGDFIDPSVLPLMLELDTSPNGMVGTSHRLLDAWPEGSFATALDQLGASLRRYAGGGI